MKTRLLEFFDRLAWITHAVDFAAETEIFRRLDQELAQLVRPFLVAPVADPNQIFTTFDRRQRMKHAHVSSFMPGPRAFRPTSTQISIGNNRAVGEHAVIVFETEIQLIFAREAVMSVVEEQFETTRKTLVVSDSLDQLRLVPFMDQHQVCIIEHAIETECFQVVTRARQLRKCSLKLAHRTASMLAKKVLDAPRVGGF